MKQLSLSARTRQELHSVWGQYPRLSLPLARHRTKNGIAADRTTDIVIEGFPRSGNTFAVVAFRLAQSRAMQVAHHLHIPAQLLWADRVGMPSMVLVRNPVDA